MYTNGMAKKTTTTRATSASTAKTAVKKPVGTPKRATGKKPARAVSNKVDYYPNRMTVAVSALAGTMLVLLAIIAVLGTR